MKQSEQHTFQLFRHRLAGAVAAVLLTFWICGAVRGQELKTGVVKQGTDCGPNLRPLISDTSEFPVPPDPAKIVSELVAWWAQQVDDKTAGDLFGKQFNRKFLAYRLCLANTGNARGRPIVYLIQDFLRVPVTISSDGQPLTTAQIQALSKRPEFENLGFSKFNAADSSDETKGLCESANAFYKPFTPEQLLDRKTYLQLGRLEISRNKLVKLNGFERRNVLTYVLKPMEKLSARQHIERILVVPEDVNIGSQHIRIVPCLGYLRFAMILNESP